MRSFLISRRVLTSCVLCVGVCTLCLMFISKHLEFLYTPPFEQSLNYMRFRHSTKSHYDVFQNLNVIDQKLVIYNRIPKTGSTSLINLVYELLGETIDVHVIHLNISNGGYHLDRFSQAGLAHNLTNWITMQPLLFHGHFAYFNFEQYGSLFEPVYINMIRDPLDRFVSYYYFRRFGDDYNPHLMHKFMFDSFKRYETFDECIINLNNGKARLKYSDCDPRYLWLQVPYFCGQAKYCRIPGNLDALQTAKRHVTEKYLLVGITEKFNETVNLLELLLPNYFKGSYDLLTKNNGWHLRRTQKKHPISESTLNFFQQNPIWQIEQAFYDFVSNEFKFIWNAVIKNKRNQNYKNLRRHLVFDKIG